MEPGVEPVLEIMPDLRYGHAMPDRQRLEADEVDVLSGVWRGVTLGSPIGANLGAATTFTYTVTNTATYATTAHVMQSPTYSSGA